MVWFRQDLRLADNPALHRAVAERRLPSSRSTCWTTGPRHLGARRRRRAGGCTTAWQALGRSLRARGAPLMLAARQRRQRHPRPGRRDRRRRRAAGTAATSPRANARDTAMRRRCAGRGVARRKLQRPPAVRARRRSERRQRQALQGVHAVLAQGLAQAGAGRPLPAPATTARRCTQAAGVDALSSCALLPTKPDWAGGFREAGRRAKPRRARALHEFPRRDRAAITGRPRPARPPTAPRACRRICIGARSRPRQVWHAAQMPDAMPGRSRGRGFPARDRLARVRPPPAPSSPATRRTEPMRRRFARFPWRQDPARPEGLAARPTGYPIVDAGMRQLWRTGWMHNRVRMIVGLLPGQAPADALAGGRGMVLGHAGRCRPGQQRRRLAMGRRLRRRCRALLPGLQSRAAGREVRSGRRLCPPLGAGTGEAAAPSSSTSPGTRPPTCLPRPASAWARPIRSRSSITPRPATGRSPPCVRCVRPPELQRSG